MGRIKNINKEKYIRIGYTTTTQNFELFDAQDNNISEKFFELNFPTIPGVTPTMDTKKEDEGLIFQGKPIIKNKNIYVVDNDVNVIGNDAFKDTDVKKIVLPEGLVGIEGMAFYQCKNLESINIPKTLHNSVIGSLAFYGCDKVTIEIPNGVKLNFEDDVDKEFFKLHMKIIG
jgi:hypothetical protein